MTEPEREDPRYDEWPIKDHEQMEMTYLGLVGNGSPYFHHDRSGTVYEGTVDEARQQISLTEDTEHSIDSETLGETIESIGERAGWESLSEFAQEHLQDEESD